VITAPARSRGSQQRGERRHLIALAAHGGLGKHGAGLLTRRRVEAVAARPGSPAVDLLSLFIGQVVG
jgi:hypothetical protein